MCASILQSQFGCASHSLCAGMDPDWFPMGISTTGLIRAGRAGLEPSGEGAPHSDAPQHPSPRPEHPQKLIFGGAMAREWGWGEVSAGSGGVKGQHGGWMLEGWA